MGQTRGVAHTRRKYKPLLRTQQALPKPWRTTIEAAIKSWLQMARWHAKKSDHVEAERCRDRAARIAAEFLDFRTPEQRKRDKWR